MEKFHEVKRTFKKFFTSSLMKKLLAVFVVGAICAGGGTYYWHLQKQANKVAAAQMRTIAIENFAKENNFRPFSC